MSALADILADLLLPGPLRGAPERLGARGCVWYQTGAASRALDRDPEDIPRSAWASAPPLGRPVPDRRRGETWRLADRLWDSTGDRLQTPRSCRPFLAVADPVANVLTLSWEWRPDSGFPDGGLDDLRRLMGSRVEEFLGETPAVARRLFQRPALHLVMLGNSETPPLELEAVVREILARTGRYVPDLQVRWQKTPSTLDRPFLRLLLGFHLPWPVWPRGSIQRLSGKRVDALAEALQGLAEAFERLKNDSVVPFKVVTELQPIVGQLQSLALLDSQDVSEADGTLPSPPFREEIFLAAQVRARRWQSNPVVVPLAPLTLVAGDNASGKTSFAEALSLAFTGLVRPRAPQPEGAHRWRDAQRPARRGSHQDGPSLAMIRLGLESGSEPREGLDSGEFLALFADDADLAAASPGDLSIVTWLGFSGLRSSSPSSGPMGLDVAALLARAFGSLAAIDRAELRRSESREKSARRRRSGLKLPEWLLGVLRDALEGEREKLSREEAKEAEDAKASGSSNARTHRARPTGTKKKLARLEESLAELAEIAKSAEPLTVSSRLVADSMDLLVGLLASHPLGVESWTKDPEAAWRDLEALDLDLGGNTDLHEFARQRASALIDTAEDKLQELSGALATLLFSGLEDFERDVKCFLAQQVKPDDMDGVRPNTAAVVRIGQASRLARWLVVSGANWPLLVIDEPTLGQDEASCARALVRYLRLMRKAEAARWLGFDHRAADSRPAFVEKVTVTDLERWGAARPKGECSETQRSGLELRIELGPFAPQAIVLSYRENALAVVADLEGTILDHQMMKKLQALIPRAWHKAIGLSLRRSHQEIEESLSALLSEAGGSISASLLRAAWAPPLADLSRQRGTAEWRACASSALQSLGAPGLAEQVEREDDADFRLLAWLLQADLLPAALADGDDYFQVATLTLRRLPAQGGVAPEEGPIRLRRLLPIQDELPSLPASWERVIKKQPVTISAEDSSRELPADRRGSAGTEQSVIARLGPELEKARAARELTTDTTTDTTTDMTATEHFYRKALDAGGAPPVQFSRGVWRVALVGEAIERLSAQAELMRLGVEAAGFETVGAHGDADARVSLQAREAGLGPVEWQWRLNLPGGDTEGSAWEEQPASIDRLLDALVRARVRALQGVREHRAPVEIVLATYNVRETPSRSAAFRFAVDLEAEDDPGSRRKRLEEVFSGGLKRLRAGLAESPKTRKLRFYPRCGLSVALRAGALFHRASGFHVECEQNGELWTTDSPGEPPSDAVFSPVSRETVAASAPELHLLLSISREVLPQYEVWRGAGGRDASAVELAPAAGPGREAIRDADDLAGWAALVPRMIATFHPAVITAHPREKEWPLRFFVATPAALAVTIGRQLNAHGRIIAMEWDKARGGYFEAFDFRA